MKAPAFWDAPDSPLGLLSAPLGWMYDMAGRIHRGTARTQKAERPVLCVGNLNVGGTGKTPVVIAIAQKLAKAGAKPHIITRGYGGTELGPMRVNPDTHRADQTGDEALLLAQAAPTWVARKRLEGAAQATQAGAGCLILDDGFQNPWIAKELSLIVVDGGAGFGNGRVMPAGPLRERVSAGLARANGVVIVGQDRHKITDLVTGLHPKMPILNATPVPRFDGPALSDTPVVAFAGIGRPEKFFQTLAAMGVTPIESHEFADHHPYTDRELSHLMQCAKARNAKLVTTQKDWVRLPDLMREQVSVVTLSIQWDDPAALDRLLEPFLRAIHHQREPSHHG